MEKSQKLPQKMRVGGVELEERSAKEYDVLKNSEKIGRIRINFQIAQVDYDDEKGYIIPYDIQIEVVSGDCMIPIETIKKAIWASLIMG